MARQYIVYRHGFDPVHQNPAHGLPEKMAVARLDADSAEQACAAAARETALGEGQYLTAEPADEADAREAATNATARTQGSPPAGVPDDLQR